MNRNLAWTGIGLFVGLCGPVVLALYRIAFMGFDPSANEATALGLLGCAGLIAGLVCVGVAAEMPAEEGAWTPMPRADGRMEWSCQHSVGHGKHPHGCDGCCSRSDYPAKGGDRP